MLIVVARPPSRVVRVRVEYKRLVFSAETIAIIPIEFVVMYCNIYLLLWFMSGGRNVIVLVVWR